MSKKDVLNDSTMDQQKRKNQSTFNAEKLRSLIRAGKNAKEMMVELNLTHKQVLKAHIQKLSTIDKTFYEVPGLFDINTRACFVNKNLEIKLNMKVIDLKGMILHPDDEFEVSVNGNTITLTKKEFNNKKETEKNPTVNTKKTN